MEKRPVGRPKSASSYKETVEGVDSGAVALVDPQDETQEKYPPPASLAVENPHVSRLDGQDKRQLFDIAQKTIRAQNEAQMKDPINEMVGSSQYIMNARFAWCRDRYGARLNFNRHYVDVGLCIDWYKAEGKRVEEEIAIKTETCAANGVKYVVVRSRQQLTPEMLRAVGVVPNGKRQ